MKKFKLIIAVLGLLLAVFIYLYFFGERSNGFRAGTISKLSDKGLIFKTGEGDLYMSMIIGENSAAAGTTNIWSFSVKDDAKLKEDLNQFMLSGKRVQLHYSEKWVRLPWRGDTAYIVDGVKSEGQ